MPTNRPIRPNPPINIIPPLNNSILWENQNNSNNRSTEGVGVYEASTIDIHIIDQNISTTFFPPITTTGRIVAPPDILEPVKPEIFEQVNAIGVLFVSLLFVFFLFRPIKRIITKMIQKYKEDRIQHEIQSRPLPSINNQHVPRRSPSPETIYIENENEYVENYHSPTSLVQEECLKEGNYYFLTKAKVLERSIGFRTVVMKSLKENTTEQNKFAFISEYQMVKNLSHPNLIQLLDSSTTPGLPVYFTMEFAELGSLRTYLRKVGLKEDQDVTYEIYERIDKYPIIEDLISSKEILSFALQIAKGMGYLVDRKIVHRHLCTKKILLTGHKICKITTSHLEQVQDGKNTNILSNKENVLENAKWLALENLSGNSLTLESNVWSFGVLLWELVSLGDTPYPSVPDQNLFKLLNSGFRMDKPHGCADELYNVMKSCWNENPSQRPTFKKISKTMENMLEDIADYIDFDLISVLKKNHVNIYV